jgi:hypothetical protein
MIINGIEIGGISQLDIDGGTPSAVYGGTITLDGGGV